MHYLILIDFLMHSFWGSCPKQLGCYTVQSWLAHCVHNHALFTIQQPDPIPFHPLSLSLDLLHYLQVGHAIIRSVTLQSGQSHCNQVGHAVIRLVMLQSGWSRLVRLVTLLSGLAGVLSLPAFVPLLCTLFPTTHCEGLTFTYMLPYLASVIVALGACSQLQLYPIPVTYHYITFSAVIPPFSFGSLYSIERWWSAQGLACRKERVGDLQYNLSSLASYSVLVCTCSITTRYQ